MKNNRLSRISMLSVSLSAGAVLASALGAMLTAGVAFAGDPMDASLDLPIDRPTVGKTITPPPVAPPVAQDPTDTDRPPQFFGHDLPSKGSIVYVIDQSGSMSLGVASFTDAAGNVVQGGTRMDRAKAELVKSITSLPASFTFNVLFYDECVRPWQQHNVDATDANKRSATAFIGGQGPLGFTNTGLAVATALQDKSNKEVVLLSDGEPNFMDCAMSYVGSFQSHRDMIKQANTQGARVDCFGIGVACDPNARQFMEQVAADNNGAYIECN